MTDRRVENRKAFKADFKNRVQIEPKTAFGKAMLNFRRAIEASGERLLSPEEIELEVRRRRGEDV